MKNHFITDNFDNVRTLQRRERTLLGDMRDAFRDRNLDEFKKLLHRTGYKNDNQVENYQNSRFSNWGFFRKFKTTRNLLFEFDDTGESLFEEILGTQGSGISKFINLIWTECELWRKREILMQTNLKGRLLTDYVVMSNDDENLFAFLVFDFEQEVESVSKSSKKYFLKLKNEQYLRRTGKSLFQKFYSIIDEDTEEIISNIMRKLLNEIEEIFDIKSEAAIDEVIAMENENLKHKILKLLTSFWRVHSKEYFHYKKILSDISPYYKLFLSLKEHNEIEFEDFFPNYINLMHSKFGETYEVKLREDFNSLLEFALQHKQRRAISLILNCPLIDPNKVIIKSRDSSYDNTHVHYVMSKLLERGFYLGNDSQIPIDWISAQVFENFLNSRVKEDGINGCQIDYNFLIPPEERSLQIKGDHDENGKLLFTRSIKPLESILNNERLKTFITHPVLSTFINLKIRKYRLIFNLNFFIFIIFYMVPFFMLVTLIPFRKFYIELFENYGDLEIVNKKKVYKILGFTRPQLLSMPYYACIFATFYLTLREVLQLFVVSGKFIEYFKKKSNQFEILLITLSLVILWGMKKYTITTAREHLSIPSAFLIILATVELLSILPYPSMATYMFMLKQVTNTFMKFFTIFIVVIIAFTFSFCVVFKPPLYNSPSPWRQLRRDWNNYTMISNNTAFGQLKEPAIMFTRTLESALEDNETIFKNFENPFTSFQKTLMMLSGEFTIDPYTLDSASKQILFLVFVCTSFILFNLINGLAINDVAQLKIQAEFLNLKQQIRSGVESEKIVCDVYWKASNFCRFTPIRKLVMYIMTLLIRRYPYLHKIDNLCVDFKNKTVKYELNQKRVHILRTHGGSNHKFILDERTCKRLSAIVEKRHSQEKTFNEKIENLEAEVRFLKTSLRSQHEEMKNLLQQILHERKE